RRSWKAQARRSRSSERHLPLNFTQHFQIQHARGGASAAWVLGCARANVSFALTQHRTNNPPTQEGAPSALAADVPPHRVPTTSLTRFVTTHPAGRRCNRHAVGAR